MTETRQSIENRIKLINRLLKYARSESNAAQVVAAGKRERIARLSANLAKWEKELSNMGDCK